MTPEQIVPLALFVMVVLFNLVGRWLRSRMQRQQERQERQPPPEARPVPVPLPPRARIVRPPRAPALEEVRGPERRAPGRVERPRRRRLLGTPGDVRRGVVLMAVLGPCRGMQPDGPDTIR